MSAACNSPTFGLNLRSLPQAAVTASLHYRCLRSTVTCGKTPVACHRNFKRIFAGFLPCYCYATKANTTEIRSRVSQLPSAGKGVDMNELQTHTACYQNREPDSCAV